MSTLCVFCLVLDAPCFVHITVGIVQKCPFKKLGIGWRKVGDRLVVPTAGEKLGIGWSSSWRKVGDRLVVVLVIMVAYYLLVFIFKRRHATSAAGGGLHHPFIIARAHRPQNTETASVYRCHVVFTYVVRGYYHYSIRKSVFVDNEQPNQIFI